MFLKTIFTEIYPYGELLEIEDGVVYAFTELADVGTDCRWQLFHENSFDKVVTTDSVMQSVVFNYQKHNSELSGFSRIVETRILR